MKKRVFIIVLVIFVLMSLVASIIAGYVNSLELTLKFCNVCADVPEKIRIVHLSDLHNAEYGEGNSHLISVVAEQKPDLIVISGDMLNREEDNTETVTSLISKLKEIAPVFYGYGNHETAWEEQWQVDLRTILENAGANVVNNDFVDLTVNGTELRIGGMMGYYRQPGMLTKDPAQKEAELNFADRFEDTDRLKLLINHIPTQWVDWHYLDKYPVDLVFSGHYHGGVVRIPLLDQGVYAPYVGWFPPYTKGVFSGTEGICVLSAGLGSEHIVPRWNNPPEIVIVDLIPAENNCGE